MIAKVYTILLLIIPVINGCSSDNDGDWYDQSLEHNHKRDEYIMDIVNAGLTAEEARDLHDRRVWEMNTINMAREGKGPDDYE